MRSAAILGTTARAAYEAWRADQAWYSGQPAPLALYACPAC